MDNVTFDISQKVKEWNNEIVQSLIPNNTILSMYMVAGLLGNSLVIFIYGFKMKGNKEDRYFIPFLAMADLWASLICASFGIAQNMMQATFDDEQLCKTWWFFAAFSTLTSVFFSSYCCCPQISQSLPAPRETDDLKMETIRLVYGINSCFYLSCAHDLLLWI